MTLLRVWKVPVSTLFLLGRGMDGPRTYTRACRREVPPGLAHRDHGSLWVLSNDPGQGVLSSYVRVQLMYVYDLALIGEGFFQGD